MNFEVRQWQSKAKSVPRIPRSKTEGGYVDSLKLILNAVEQDKEKEFIIEFEGRKSPRSLDEHCINLRPLGMVYQQEKFRKWLMSEEIIAISNGGFKSEDIASYLNSKVKYFSEMLNFLKKPRGINEILKNAQNIYKLNWKDNNQIYERLYWLRDLNLVGHIKHEKKYQIKNEGIEFLTKNPPIDVNEIEKFVYDMTEEETTLEIPAWLDQMYKFNWSKNEKRNNSIGYIPGGLKNAFNIINETLDMARDIIDFESINNFIKTNLNSSVSSVGHFLSTLSKARLLERKGEKIYRVTDIGEKLIDSNNPNLYLILILHSNFKFVLEILKAINEKELTIKELASIGKTQYGMDSENVDQVRKRVQLLKNAKLVLDDSKKTFSLTNRGKLLLDIVIEYDNQASELTITTLQEEPDNDVGSLYNLLTDLRLASTDSANPNKFEKLLNEVFVELGFTSELLAKSGTTDILLTAPTAPKFTYTVAVDAKTNREGKITDNHIDFETLKEHKIKHSADYVVVIGKSFFGKRVVKRALANKIVLINIDVLEELVKKHYEFPLQAVEYLPLFQQSGEVDLTVLNDSYSLMSRRKMLFKLIIEALIENSTDKYTGGIITTDNIYFIIKGNEIFSDIPLEKEELVNMLNLLSNPLIDCVGETKDGYYAKGSIKDAALKFGFYYGVSSNK